MKPGTLQREAEEEERFEVVCMAGSCVAEQQLERQFHRLAVDDEKLGVGPGGVEPHARGERIGLDARHNVKGHHISEVEGCSLGGAVQSCEGLWM